MTDTYHLSILNYAETLTVSSEETLLDALVESGFRQRNACRNGVCQICDAELLSGAVLQRYPSKNINVAQGAESIYLCTSYPRSNLSIQLIRAEFPVQD